MQLIAARSAQHFNQRKKRKGAYWEDRYHTTAIQNDQHLSQCMAYIDLNMVRAGVIKHPKDWPHSGFYEIKNPPSRYRIINFKALMRLYDVNNIKSLQERHNGWATAALKLSQRQSFWSDSIAVGNQQYVEMIHLELGDKATGRQCINEGERFIRLL